MSSTEWSAAKQDKPEGERLGWTVLETRYPLRNPWLILREDRVRIAGNGEIAFTYAETTPAVYVVPITRSGDLVLIRQYRYPIDAWSLEVPAGGSHDFPGVPLEQVARVELEEEIGGVCEEMLPVATFSLQAAKSAQMGQAFPALGVDLGVPPHPAATERIMLHPVPIAEAYRMLHTGEILDCQSATALLVCEPVLRGRGLLG